MKTLISVIITTYNRSGHLMVVLDSLRQQRQDASFEFEVIIVDNNSSDGTKGVVEKESSKWDGRLKYFLETQKGKSNGLNKGIGEARGEIIAFTDDDVIVDPLWLLNIIQCLQQYSCDGVGGRVLPEFPLKTPQWVKDNSLKLAGAVVIYDYGQKTMKLETSMYPFIGANYAFKRSVFTDCGLFRTDLGPGMPVMGEDTEFIQRVMAQGKILYYSGDVLIRHPFDPERLKLKHMARWHMSLGRFDALREMQKGQVFVYCFGAPRYLIKGSLNDIWHLACNIFNKPAFYNSWRSLYRKVGMIQEYRSHTPR